MKDGSNIYPQPKWDAGGAWQFSSTMEMPPNMTDHMRRKHPEQLTELEKVVEIDAEICELEITFIVL